MGLTVNQRWIGTISVGLTLSISGTLLGAYISVTDRLTKLEQYDVSVGNNIKVLGKVSGSIMELHGEMQQISGAVSTMQLTDKVVGDNVSNAIKTSEAAIDIVRTFENQLGFAQELMREEVQRSVQMTALLNDRLQEIKENLRLGTADRFRGEDYKRVNELWTTKFEHLQQRVTDLARRIERLENEK